MDIKEWLDQVAYIDDSEIDDDDSEIYYSKFDGSYITRVGMEEDVKFLADREITKQLTHGVGFSPRDHKWYGWSHRGICGFTIGSEVKKGDVAYTPANIEDTLEDSLEFWHDEEYYEKTTGEIIDSNTIKITYHYNDKVPNDSLKNKIQSQTIHWGDEDFGRGEWVAETMDDAKQMAIDYNENIS